MLVEQLMALNPDANRNKMLSRRSFSANGLLKDWNLRFCDIAKLPETFGNVLCTGVLCLSNNLLNFLPLRFSNLSVGGDLYLDDNNLTIMEPHFRQIRVGGNLSLSGNRSCLMPEMQRRHQEFPNVKGTVYRPGLYPSHHSLRQRLKSFQM